LREGRGGERQGKQADGSAAHDALAIGMIGHDVPLCFYDARRTSAITAGTAGLDVKRAFPSFGERSDDEGAAARFAHGHFKDSSVFQRHRLPPRFRSCWRIGGSASLISNYGQ
jgi:hypothetical protein